jgi:integrase
LDLELGCVVSYEPTGTWLRVPLGKLGTERAVPLDANTVAELDAWAAHRGQHRPRPHPRTGKPTEYLFAEHGRRLGPWPIRKRLADAAAAAGMNLQALMALLGHVTPR